MAEYITKHQVPCNSLYRHHPTATSAELKEVGFAISVYWACNGLKYLHKEGFKLLFVDLCMLTYAPNHSRVTESGNLCLIVVGS